MPSSELKYCHFIPGLDFRLSANTVDGREQKGNSKYVKNEGRIKGEKGGLRQERKRVKGVNKEFSTFESLRTFNVTENHNLFQEGGLSSSREGLTV